MQPASEKCSYLEELSCKKDSVKDNRFCFNQNQDTDLRQVLCSFEPWTVSSQLQHQSTLERLKPPKGYIAKFLNFTCVIGFADVSGLVYLYTLEINWLAVVNILQHGLGWNPCVEAAQQISSASPHLTFWGWLFKEACTSPVCCICRQKINMLCAIASWTQVCAGWNQWLPLMKSLQSC